MRLWVREGRVRFHPMSLISLETLIQQVWKRLISSAMAVEDRIGILSSQIWPVLLLQTHRMWKASPSTILKRTMAKASVTAFTLSLNRRCLDFLRSCIHHTLLHNQRCKESVWGWGIHCQVCLYIRHLRLEIILPGIGSTEDKVLWWRGASWLDNFQTNLCDKKLPQQDLLQAITLSGGVLHLNPWIPA